MPHIRLLRKYAAVLDGFDLTNRSVGDVFVVDDEVAGMLAREGWAEPVQGDADERASDETVSFRRKLKS